MASSFDKSVDAFRGSGFEFPETDFWVDTLPGQSVLRPWDQLTLGNVGPFPGIWQLQLDVADSYETTKRNTNVSGTNLPPKYKLYLFDKGQEAAKLTAIGRLWLKDQWDEMKDIMSTIYPKKLTTRTLYKISHPVASLMGIENVAIVGISVMPPTEQSLIIKISLVQWYQPTPILPIIPFTGTALSNKPPKPNASANMPPT